MSTIKNRILNYLLISNNFRIAYYLYKFLSIFSIDYKTDLILFNFFKKRKKKYSKKLITCLINPKIFIINVDINNNEFLKKFIQIKNFI